MDWLLQSVREPRHEVPLLPNNRKPTPLRPTGLDGVLPRPKEMTMKTQPLNDLEMFDLLQACYPEKFPDDEDGTFEAALDFTSELSGFDDLADLLGRVVMLTMPMKSGLTERLSHCLGPVKFSDGAVHMMAVVSRDVSPNSQNSAPSGTPQPQGADASKCQAVSDASKAASDALQFRKDMLEKHGANPKVNNNDLILRAEAWFRPAKYKDVGETIDLVYDMLNTLKVQQSSSVDNSLLLPFGYAPGKYICKCNKCGQTANDVDKLAVTCLPCAEISFKNHLTSAKSNSSPELILVGWVETNGDLVWQDKNAATGKNLYAFR